MARICTSFPHTGAVSFFGVFSLYSLLVFLCTTALWLGPQHVRGEEEKPRRRVDHFLAQLAAQSANQESGKGDPHANHQHDRNFNRLKRQPSLLDLIHQPETRAGTAASPSPLPFAGVDAQKKSAIVDITASGDSCGEDLQAALRDLGFKLTGVWGRVCSGWLPLNKVGAVEALDGINFVRTCLVTTQRGRATSEGVLAMRAGPADLRRLPYDGTGIVIGILSDSFDTNADAATRMADDIASGDLPAPPNLRIVSEDTEMHQSDEGRAMAQIVHDVAPGAAIEFFSASGGQAAFAAGIEKLAETCHVIVDDVSYLDEPMFMDGIIGQAVEKAVQKGVVFVSAAGNQGHASYESTFTPGPSFARHAFGPEFLGGIAHTFDGISNQRIIMRAGSTLALTMQWAQPFFSEGGPGSNTDYDMYLLHDDDGDGRPDNLLATATDNSVGGDPVETLWYHNAEAKSVTVYLMILHRHHQVHPVVKSNVTAPINQTTRGVGEGDGEEEENEGGMTFSSDAPPPPHPMGWIDGAAGERIKYVDFGNVHLNEAAAGAQAGTLYGHRNARDALTVGSAYFRQTPAFGRSPPVANARSSVGGVPVWRDGVWEESTKPDIVGPDGVVTTFFPRKNAPNFFGTSAAAPHVAGVVAMLLQARPELTPLEVRQILTQTAIDMKEEDIPGFDPGFDSHTGNGMIDAAAALRLALGLAAEPPLPPVVSDGEPQWGILGIALGGGVLGAGLLSFVVAFILYKRRMDSTSVDEQKDKKQHRLPLPTTAKHRLFGGKRFAHLHNSHSDMSLSHSDTSSMLSPMSPPMTPLTPASNTSEFEMQPFMASSPTTASDVLATPAFPKSSRDTPLRSTLRSPPQPIGERRPGFLSPTTLNLPLATSGEINLVLTEPTPTNNVKLTR